MLPYGHQKEKKHKQGTWLAQGTLAHESFYMLTWKKNQTYLKDTKSYSDLVRLFPPWFFCWSNPNATKFITVLLTSLFSPYFTCNLSRLSYCCPNPRYLWVPHPSILVFMHLCFYQLSRKHQISTTAALCLDQLW